MFLPSAEILVQVCIDSCFGQSSLSLGIRVFSCSGMESRLTDCEGGNNDTERCNEDAGFACCKCTFIHVYT